ncbi:hypothetical protein DPMN_075492 [Dreissena polymorpha]|uniref:Uncharacterized protein n=1 Tax=Dreissena polymorpha TaxID=45954 RepID=A0A9D3YLS9_DREPO|nr:hypothetical protein DPMN_075492 [Dreissena polymorpha]
MRTMRGREGSALSGGNEISGNRQRSFSANKAWGLGNDLMSDCRCQKIWEENYATYHSQPIKH